MNDKGFNVVAYNRTTSKVDHFLANEAKGTFTSRPIYFQSRLTITQEPMSKVHTPLKSSFQNSSALARLSFSLKPGPL